MNRSLLEVLYLLKKINNRIHDYYKNALSEKRENIAYKITTLKLYLTPLF